MRGINVSTRHTLPAMKLVQSSRVVQRLAHLLLALMVLAIVAMAFAPWQQSARGSGNVAAFAPQERQQTYTSQVKGVVLRVGKGLYEGTRVKQGQFILELEPAAANLVDQLTGQRTNLETKLGTAHTKVEVYRQNETDFAAARDYAVKAAGELVEAAEAKLQAKQNTVIGYQAKELQSRLNYERQKGLFDKGIKPEKEIEKFKKDWDVAKADLTAAQREITAAEKEVAAKKSELKQKRREAQTKVDYARAMREDALGQAATIEKEIRDLNIKLAELDRLVITAPRDGTIFRMPLFERGQVVKQGDPLFTIVPDATQRAVELWVSGNDIPLVREGQHVRLQFEGWPAVQFTGWPSVAVGTFGGEVASVDATDDGTGKFRVLVLPGDDADWPSDRFLRQGVRANGWVMLSQVSLGYEIWRQLNGFPPVISTDEPGKKSGDEKSKVKLPK